MTTKACSVLVYLPTGNPAGVRSATVRGRTCRVSVAPPGKAADLNKLELRGGAVILTWRDEGTPLIGAVPDIHDAGTTLRHLRADVSVAVVTNEQDFLPTGVFGVVAEVLTGKVSHGASKESLEVEPWCRSLGETMAETALLLVAVLRVPGFG